VGNGRVSNEVGGAPVSGDPVSGDPGVVERVIAALLAALAARDLEAVGATLADDVTWANVPHPPAVGRTAVVDMLAAVVAQAEAVRWDVVSAAYAGDRAHLERLDRFWIGGQECVAPCHGVFHVDRRQARIVEVRDYVDLAPWRAVLAGAKRSKLPHD
jgi:limonene-1,2-epoxide hydrolase